MQKTGAKGFSLLTVVFLIASVLLRLFMLLFSLPNMVSLALYALVILSIVFCALSLKGDKEFSNAFSLKNNGKISLMSFVASVGFFVDFVHQCVVIFKQIDTELYRNLIQFVPICIVCLFALVSCFYFLCIGVSFKNDAYDFRLLKIFHIAPLLWSVAYVLTILSTPIKPLNDVSLMLKYATIIALVCFLYFFALEIENKDSTNKFVLLFAKAFSILAVVFFIDRVLLIFINHSSVVNDDNVFAISALFICLFTYSFEREIIRNSNLPKGV